MARVLVVDDEEPIRVLLAQVLRRAGYAVTCAVNGDDALRCLHAEPADLVVTDLIMPGKEGIETITDIRREYPGVGIIAMSGGGRAGPGNYLALAERLGADRSLAKPFDRNVLLEAIREVLAEKAKLKGQ